MKVVIHDITSILNLPSLYVLFPNDVRLVERRLMEIAHRLSESGFILDSPPQAYRYSRRKNSFIAVRLQRRPS